MEVSFPAQLVDILMSLLALFVTAVVILRYRFLGAFLGGIAYYYITIGRLELRYIMTPNWEGGITDAMSGLQGLIVGAIWCAVFLFGRLAYDWRRKVRQSNSE